MSEGMSEPDKLGPAVGGLSGETKGSHSQEMAYPSLRHDKTGAVDT